MSAIAKKKTYELERRVKDAQHKATVARKAVHAGDSKAGRRLLSELQLELRAALVLAGDIEDVLFQSAVATEGSVRS